MKRAKQFVLPLIHGSSKKKTCYLLSYPSVGIVTLI